MGSSFFRQEQRYAESGSTRVYRNLRMATALLVFAGLVLGLILRSALAASTPTAARGFGLAVVAILGVYVVRAVLVHVRITPERVVVGNILRTYRLRWDEIAAVQTVSVTGSALFGGASFVAFSLRDGRLIRAQALRRTDSDATAIARDLTGWQQEFHPDTDNASATRSP